MWEPILVTLFVGALIWGSLQASRKSLRAWQDAAASCGLQVVETAAGLPPRLKARSGPIEVWIKASRNAERPIQIEVMVLGPPDFHNVSIRPESPLGRDIKIGGESLFIWDREIEIGDESFDDKFFVGGPMRLVLALFDADMRRLLLRMSSEAWLEISHGALRVDIADKKVPDFLPLLLDIGQRFAQPLDVPRRLAENANRDPEPGVRLQNLLLLIHELPEDPATIEALRTACSDSSPEIRLRAAKELGAEGREVLLELAESLEVDDAFSALAVSALGGEMPFERTKAILDHAISHRRIQTARACVEVLGQSGVTAIDPLAKVLTQEKGGLATAAAEALGMTGSPAAEPALISALQREPSDLQVAAATALGRIGSVAAVLPLKEAGERSWLDLDLRRATRQAIAEIQSRIHGASPGQLSISGAEAGQLSLAQSEAGQLSLATDSAGQLSLSAGEPGQLSLSPGEE